MGKVKQFLILLLCFIFAFSSSSCLSQKSGLDFVSESDSNEINIPLATQWDAFPELPAQYSEGAKFAIAGDGDRNYLLYKSDDGKWREVYSDYTVIDKSLSFAGWNGDILYLYGRRGFYYTDLRKRNPELTSWITLPDSGAYTNDEDGRSISSAMLFDGVMYYEHACWSSGQRQYNGVHSLKLTAKSIEESKQVLPDAIDVSMSQKNNAIIFEDEMDEGYPTPIYTYDLSTRKAEKICDNCRHYILLPSGDVLFSNGEAYSGVSTPLCIWSNETKASETITECIWGAFGSGQNGTGYYDGYISDMNGWLYYLDYTDPPRVCRYKDGENERLFSLDLDSVDAGWVKDVHFWIKIRPDGVLEFNGYFWKKDEDKRDDDGEYSPSGDYPDMTYRSLYWSASGEFYGEFPPKAPVFTFYDCNRISHITFADNVQFY